jgi:hypothetical protein
MAVLLQQIAWHTTHQWWLHKVEQYAFGCVNLCEFVGPGATASLCPRLGASTHTSLIPHKFRNISRQDFQWVAICRIRRPLLIEQWWRGPKYLQIGLIFQFLWSCVLASFTVFNQQFSHFNEVANSWAIPLLFELKSWSKSNSLVCFDPPLIKASDLDREAGIETNLYRW